MLELEQTGGAETQKFRPARVRFQFRLDQAGELVCHVVSIDNVGISVLEQTHAFAHVGAVVEDELVGHADALSQTLQAISDVNSCAVGSDP